MVWTACEVRHRQCLKRCVMSYSRNYTADSTVGLVSYNTLSAQSCSRVEWQTDIGSRYATVASATHNLHTAEVGCGQLIAWSHSMPAARRSFGATAWWRLPQKLCYWSTAFIHSLEKGEWWHKTLQCHHSTRQDMLTGSSRCTHKLGLWQRTVKFTWIQYTQTQLHWWLMLPRNKYKNRQSLILNSCPEMTLWVVSDWTDGSVDLNSTTRST